MDKLFLKMPCLSESKQYSRKEIYEKLFDKKVDKRYLETAVQKFLQLNRSMFEFLGIDTVVGGFDQELSVAFASSRYIGAIPVRMPYDGKVHKDFQVVPRFQTEENDFSHLTRMLSMLEYSICPEYDNSALLSLPLQLRPPVYYESVKYLDLFQKAQKHHWQKFNMITRNHSQPKASTQWNQYVLASYDPQKATVFPAHDNVPSVDHEEWRKLRYVLDIAVGAITDSSVPVSLKCKYDSSVKMALSSVKSIPASPVSHFEIRASDPPYIKALKQQANTLLRGNSTVCAAWRMDIAALFERFTQYVVQKSVEPLAGSIISNHKISAYGDLPVWGLKYIEPDILVRLNPWSIMADAKYKAHFYSQGKSSQILKDSFRDDLHQLLSYCAFEPQARKTGVLFYPSSSFGKRRFEFYDKFSGSQNSVYICGIPFDAFQANDTIMQLKELFSNIVKQ